MAHYNIRGWKNKIEVWNKFKELRWIKSKVTWLNWILGKSRDVNCNLTFFFLVGRYWGVGIMWFELQTCDTINNVIIVELSLRLHRVIVKENCIG